MTEGNDRRADVVNPGRRLPESHPLFGGQCLATRYGLFGVSEHLIHERSRGLEHRFVFTEPMPKYRRLGNRRRAAGTFLAKRDASDFFERTARQPHRYRSMTRASERGQAHRKLRAAAQLHLLGAFECESIAYELIRNVVIEAACAL